MRQRNQKKNSHCQESIRQEKLVGHDQEAAVEVCWTLSKERVNSEICLGREDPRERQRGRRRLNFLGGLTSAVGSGEVGVLRRAGDRNGFRRLVADVRPWHGT